MSNEFKIEKSQKIEGVQIISPSVSNDARGNIWTSFMKDDIEALLPEGLFFKHDKFSESKSNVLRGIHGDDKTWKLVTCVFGEVYQVVADLRKSSPTFMQWESFIINKEIPKLFLIPPGVGNAYYVSSEKAVYHYKLAYPGEYFDINNQFTFPWNDERLGINWPTKTPFLSSRDEI
ncbi:dTDP-4-dehydrorhamnose 3,5-epimerase family protein [Candidatus Pseudothioglobus singularis]|mgnify:FL=1|jgi:dTDP-4-dehydrorhamnose 3,5-epimerase|nr:dTDP-4-dehydrorhamnose 3,5-epimerase family protein [Candidatus Pseudothioglobus singularis]MDB4847814.1 dTDP-4-dehydrorhamnose 3,5-epimerase family protein [Candidatus Pseudothioglobus singularis]